MYIETSWLSSKQKNIDMEDVMSNYSELVIFFLMLPVGMQIIVPLLMLLWWGFISLIRKVLRRQNTVNSLKDEVGLSGGVQFS